MGFYCITNRSMGEGLLTGTYSKAATSLRSPPHGVWRPTKDTALKLSAQLIGCSTLDISSLCSLAVRIPSSPHPSLYRCLSLLLLLGGGALKTLSNVCSSNVTFTSSPVTHEETFQLTGNVLIQRKAPNNSGQPELQSKSCCCTKVHKKEDQRRFFKSQIKSP